jgi:hypothetical protein
LLDRRLKRCNAIKEYKAEMLCYSSGHFLKKGCIFNRGVGSRVAGGLPVCKHRKEKR